MAREGVRSGGVHDPENYCPICGVKLTQYHKCAESVLRAIDGAHHRDPDEISPFSLERPLCERLNAGLKIVTQDLRKGE